MALLDIKEMYTRPPQKQALSIMIITNKKIKYHNLIICLKFVRVIHKINI